MIPHFRGFKKREKSNKKNLKRNGSEKEK